jgi:cell wall-associated NlpC family hydrolase
MAPPPAWASDYIGLPFLVRGRDARGCDCWGLVRLVLGERFGIEVPSYAGDYETIEDHGRLAALVNKGISTTETQRHREREGRAPGAPRDPRCLYASVVHPAWSEVDPGQECPGDVLLLRLRGLPIHVGLLVAKGWMLHTREATGSVLERLDGLAWGRRVLGTYRYQGPFDKLRVRGIRDQKETARDD